MNTCTGNHRRYIKGYQHAGTTYTISHSQCAVNELGQESCQGKQPEMVINADLQVLDGMVGDELKDTENDQDTGKMMMSQKNRFRVKNPAFA